MSAQNTEPVVKWDHKVIEGSGKEYAWGIALHNILGVLVQIPKKGSTWAFLSRHSKDGMQSQLVPTNMDTTDDVRDFLLKLEIDPANQSFTVNKFFYHDVLIGIRITITAGANQGTHYLVSPNEFEDSVNTKLQFMRAMDTAADNRGTPALDKAQI